MRAVRIHEHGDESVLRIDEVDVPEPAADEVLIEVRVAAINPFDTYVREGIVPPDGGLPHVLGGDGAGVVEAVGEDVSVFEPGDRVFTTGLGLDRPGTYAEYAAVPEHRLASLPDEVSFDEAAAAAETVTTSIQALERGRLSEGDVCLVQGATGGVGHAAVQVADYASAFVVGTCSPDAADAAREFGADAVVDYAADDLAGAVLEATDGRPVDIVVETHADANVAADVEVLGEDGAVVVLGEDDTIEIDGATAGTAKAKQLDLRFISHMRATEHHGEKLVKAATLLADGEVSAAVAERFPLEAADEAQRHCLSSGVIGKTLLDVSGGE